MGARALFAFYTGECDEYEGKRTPSDDALLGGLMLAEDRALRMQFCENFVEFAKAWAKSKQRRGRK